MFGEIMPNICVETGLIGVPAIKIPVDEDLAKLFAASQGQLLVPILLIQNLRKQENAEEGLRKLENKIANIGVSPECLLHSRSTKT